MPSILTVKAYTCASAPLLSCLNITFDQDTNRGGNVMAIYSLCFRHFIHTCPLLTGYTIGQNVSSDDLFAWFKVIHDDQGEFAFNESAGWVAQWLDATLLRLELISITNNATAAAQFPHGILFSLLQLLGF